LRTSFRPGTYAGSSETAETLGAHSAEKSPLREKDRLHGPKMTETAGKTAGLGDTTLPARMILLGRLKEEETERLLTP